MAIEKVTAYKDPDSWGSLTEEKEDLLSSSRRKIIRKYLGDEYESGYPYRDDSLPYYKKEEIDDTYSWKYQRDFAKEIWKEAYDRGYKDGGRHKDSNLVSKLITFYPQIMAELEALDKETAKLN